jgi:hypothetical protein
MRVEGALLADSAPSPQPLSREGRGAEKQGHTLLAHRGRARCTRLPSPLAGEGRGERGRARNSATGFREDAPQEHDGRRAPVVAAFACASAGRAEIQATAAIGPLHCSARVVLEADGGQHNGSESDSTRDAWLKQQGFQVLRFWNDEILKNTEGVLETVWAAVNAAAPSAQPLSRQGRGAEKQGHSLPLPRGRGP